MLRLVVGLASINLLLSDVVVVVVIHLLRHRDVLDESGLQNESRSHGATEPRLLSPRKVAPEGSGRRTALPDSRRTSRTSTSTSPSPPYGSITA